MRGKSEKARGTNETLIRSTLSCMCSTTEQVFLWKVACTTAACRDDPTRESRNLLETNSFRSRVGFCSRSECNPKSISLSRTDRRLLNLDTCHLLHLALPPSLAPSTVSLSLIKSPLLLRSQIASDHRSNIGGSKKEPSRQA